MEFKKITEQDKSFNKQSHKRKYKPDDIRKKIKARFHKSIKNIINDKMIYLKEIINTCIERNFKGELDISSDNYLENAILKKKI